jgi:CP family cyanate transporter-like MFS transporter
LTERRFWGAAGLLVLVGLNLRLAIAAIPPVLGQIRADTGLSSVGSGLLTALPIVCFGVVALLTPTLIKRLQLAPVVTVSLVAIALGCVVRLDPTLLALFAGTAVVGSGIAIGNVLVPSLIKHEFADRAALMIGLYSVSLPLGAAISAGLTVPVEHLLGVGWRPAVAIWGLVALAALALWIPRTRELAPVTVGEEAEGVGRALWRDKVAWAVTAFMGLQSLAYYAILSWLPSILESHDMSAAEAGWMLAFSMFPGMLAALATPNLGRHVRSPGLLVLATSALLGSAYLGLLLSPTTATYLWVTLLGLGQGATLALSLGFIVARSPDSHHAAHLSTMSQSVGYLIAATGPFAVGALHSLTDGWSVPLLVLVANLVPLTISGIVASRNRDVLRPG